MQPQHEKLILMLAHSIDMLHDRNAFQVKCSELGKRHVKYGALAEHYPTVIRLTLDEIARVAHPPLSTDEQSCWELLLGMIGEQMLTGSGQTTTGHHQG
jgi:hemoglobin-like flavoprotein